MFGIGHFPELIIVLVVALVIFGPGKLPEIGRSLGQGIRYFRQSTSELERTFAGAFEDPPPAPTPQTPGADALAAAGGSLEQPHVASLEPVYQAATHQTETVVYPIPSAVEPPVEHSASIPTEAPVMHPAIPPVEVPVAHVPAVSVEPLVIHAPSSAPEPYAPVAPPAVSSTTHTDIAPSTLAVVTHHEAKSVDQSETPGVAAGAAFQTAFAPVVEEPTLPLPAPPSTDVVVAAAGPHPRQRTRRVRKAPSETPAPAEGDLTPTAASTAPTSVRSDAAPHADTAE